MAVTNTCRNATVNGVLTKLAPMKEGEKSELVHGELSDGNARMQIYGFDRSEAEEAR